MQINGSWNGTLVSTHINRHFELQQIDICLLATAYKATVEGGIFKPTEVYAFARGLDIMNSKSSKTFRWSVRLLTCINWFSIGIASKLERGNAWIHDYDRNSIFFDPYDEKIYNGMGKNFPSNITNVKPGDEIHFRFEPKLKKFTISFVRSIIPSRQ